eukprot:3319950-Pleurochrysis_carterae.AAC.1
MGGWRTKVGEQVGGAEHERGESSTHTHGEGVSNGGSCHVCGTHDRLWDRRTTTIMESHLERIPKVRTERG